MSDYSDLQDAFNLAQQRGDHEHAMIFAKQLEAQGQDYSGQEVDQAKLQQGDKVGTHVWDGTDFVAPEDYSHPLKSTVKETSPVPVESQLDRNSFLQNYFAGIGQSAVNTGRGIGQIARHLMPDRLANGIGLPTQEDIDNAKKLDAPLLSTGGGMVGNIAGNIALEAQ